MICSNCLGYPSLSSFVSNRGELGLCQYCNEPNVIVLDAESIFSYIEERLDEILIPINDCSRLKDLFYNADEDIVTYNCYITYINDVFLEYCPDTKRFNDLAPEPFRDLAEDYIDDNALRGPFCTIFEANRYNDLGNESERWKQLIRRLNHQFRYINIPLLEAYNQWLSPLKIGQKLNQKFLYKMEKNEAIYRARVFNNNQERESIISSPFEQLGPAPLHFTSDQRMTPAGVSAFYGATDRETCLAEIRCDSGTQAISGEFRSLYDIQLLDLSGLKVANSNIYEDPFIKGVDYIAAEFTHELYEHLVMPAKNENKDTYRVTQSFFEYLRSEFIGQIQGVCFPSVQSGDGSINIVLFPEYSVVQDSLKKIYSPYYNNGKKPYANEFMLRPVELSQLRQLNGLLGKPIIRFEKDSLIEHTVSGVKISKTDRKVV